MSLIAGLCQKVGTFMVIVGLDNVGKTNFMLWYFYV